MREVVVDLGVDRSYKVIIGSGILLQIGGLTKNLMGQPKIMLISNPLVFSLYGARVVDSLQGAGLAVSIALMPDGEEYKSLEQLRLMLDEAVTAGLERSSVIMALGGGVVGDLAGFTASIYQRGIPCIQIPTTLLAQVDSSVGGKTAVNHPRGKNLIGTFHQPALVLIDTDTLNTLAEEEFQAGLGEVVKYGIIYDYELFQLLEDQAEGLRNREAKVVQEVVLRCVQIKSQIVSRDEKESGLRMILNLGHTFGHSIEKLGHYKEVKHGQAVAIGTLMASILARNLGYLKAGEVERIAALFKRLGISLQLPAYSAQLIYEGMLNDKKVKDKSLRVIVPKGIGGYDIIINPAADILLQAIKELAAYQY
ncbi:MAG: 3-dehydroquinate synthase [Syntrophomonadaceae bacterium]|nr:3-dehydroquinate synthase [Syntrophomonadaceae bacterium]